MFIQEFDSSTWGSLRKAIAARARRTKELEDAGFEVDLATRRYGISGQNRGYRLFAHKEGEVQMVTPAQYARDEELASDRETLQKLVDRYTHPASVLRREISEMVSLDEVALGAERLQLVVDQKASPGPYCTSEPELSQEEWEQVSLVLQELSKPSKSPLY